MYSQQPPGGGVGMLGPHAQPPGPPGQPQQQPQYPSGPPNMGQPPQQQQIQSGMPMGKAIGSMGDASGYPGGFPSGPAPLPGQGRPTMPQQPQTQPQPPQQQYPRGPSTMGQPPLPQQPGMGMGMTNGSMGDAPPGVGAGYSGPGGFPSGPSMQGHGRPPMPQPQQPQAQPGPPQSAQQYPRGPSDMGQQPPQPQSQFPSGPSGVQQPPQPQQPQPGMGMGMTNGSMSDGPTPPGAGYPGGPGQGQGGLPSGPTFQGRPPMPQMQPQPGNPPQPQQYPRGPSPMGQPQPQYPSGPQPPQPQQYPRGQPPLPQQPGMGMGMTNGSMGDVRGGYPHPGGHGPGGFQSGPTPPTPQGYPPLPLPQVQPQPGGLPNGPMSHGAHAPMGGPMGGMGGAPPMPGMQPQLQPGMQPYPGQGFPGQQGPGVGYPSSQAPNQGRKLDPDQMPSAIGVMQEDQQNRGGTFQTGQRGLLPPLVTTKFLVEDLGNASPRFVRSTMYSVPAQPDMLKQTAVPFALIVNPFEDPGEGESPLACVDLGPMGPVRCIRCKAYMSPLMQFIDGGRRFQCLLCKATTEVPPEYFQHLDHTGQRVDKWERPELWRGSYEYMATLEYCRNSVVPKEPAYIFVLDVSYNNVKSGLVNLICNQMPSLLEMLPPHTPVGFITYNSKVHFYNIDPNLAQPQMVIVPDVADMFMPILTGFMVPRAEATKSVAALMTQIPAMFGDTKETDAVLGPAIQAGMEALKASERVGKLLLLHSALPSSDAAPGKLKNREAERKLLGTDKEKVVLTPQSTYYNTLGQECVGNGVSVDLYLFNNSYIDVATIGQVARITGGSVNKYTYFQAEIDGARVIGELKLHLARPTAFDGVMRVRTSTGVRPTDFHGHFYMSNTTDVELAAIDSYKGIAVEIKHDDKLTDEEGVYIQIALLYTSIYGQRRLRVHNLALNTCLQMADLYRNCELDAVINFLAKQCISKSIDATPQTIKDGVITRCAQMLATYRKHCANPSMPGQLILPECLKLLPLYVNCVLRSDAVSGNQELTPDDRSWLMYTVMTMGVGSSVHYFYPKLIPVAGPTATLDNPTPIRCSHDKLRDDSAFILENGIYIFLWIGSAVSPDWLQNIFGINNLAQLNVEVITELPDQINTDESLQLKALIRSLRTQRQRHMRLTVIRQRDKMELVMNKFLVEDRSSDGHASYVDFLCHMHKEIRGILNQ